MSPLMIGGADVVAAGAPEEEREIGGESGSVGVLVVEAGMVGSVLWEEVKLPACEGGV